MKRLIGFAGLFSLLALSGCNIMHGCPSEEQVKKVLSKKISESTKIVSIKPVENMKGLCEIVLKDGMSVAVIYSDRDVSRVIVGNLYETKSDKNLTLEAIRENMKMTKDEVSKLNELVNMEIGSGDRFVYYLTAPNCNACKLFEDILLPWAAEKKIKVKVILAPNPIDFNSYDLAVGLLCDKKNLEDMRKGYTSKNLCEEGKKAIDKNAKFIYQDMKFPGVPQIIGSNGRVISQIPTRGLLDELVK